jgi:hypothetical protein
MTSINFYKITSTNTDKVYIGSTKKSINERLQKHEANYRHFKDGKTNYTTSFEILEFKNCKIELLENKFCQSKEEQDMVECNYIINTPNTVNKYLPGRTKEQYYQDNKEDILTYQRQYRQENKEHILEQQRQYRQDNKEDLQRYYRENKEYYNRRYIENKEHILEQHRQYKQENKEHILERQRQYYQVNEQKIKEKHNCLCGGKYTYSSKTRHFKTAKHITYHIRNEQKQN